MSKSSVLHWYHTTQKATPVSFPLRTSSVNVTKSAGKLGDLVIFTEEILYEKLCFLCGTTKHDKMHFDP